jgi:hypothetical protein
MSAAGISFRGFISICWASPEPVGPGRAWHCFRPNGEAFRAHVELAVLVDGGGRIRETQFGLDRAFIGHSRNDAFARDLVKSYR